MRWRGAPPLGFWVVAGALGVWWVAGQDTAAGTSASSSGGTGARSDDSFVFTQQEYNGTIYENTYGKVYIQTTQKMGIYPKRPGALDLEYTIVGGNNNSVFKAETVTVKDFCFLRIRTQTVNYGMLNRELNSLFQLRVKARASYPGDLTLEAYTTVRVTVLDVNEFSPLFSNVPYQVSIPEDTPLHKSIGQVKASDADIGINGEIYYRFAQNTLVFAIHPTTGVVSLSRPVSYYDKNVYELDVLAQDRGDSSLSRGMSPNSKTKFTVNVLPVNFNPPTITVHSQQSLTEHGNIGSLFAVLTITDGDHGKNGEIGGVDITSDPRNLFRLDRETEKGKYSIIVASPIDREALPENYNITILAVDSGSPPKTSTVRIPVRVQDINDNEPEFEQSVYNVELSEIVPVNTPVVFVKAHDRDTGSNAEVRYSIVDGNKKDLFVIDPQSGLIRTSGELDTEVDPRFTLVVQAIDQANSGSRKTGQARVIILVKDYNDNGPVFNLAQDYVNVRENLPPGSRVLNVLASDEDSGDNGKLSYSIVNYDTVPFEMNPFTGEITTKEVLDFETMQRSYELHLRVSDWGSPFKREEDMVLTVKLQDVNDNSPEFEKNKCSGYLSRESPLKMDVVTLTAIDLDSGDIIKYIIVDGNGDDCFSVVPSTGVVSVNCDMSRYYDGTRTLTVVASDGHHVSIPATVELNLVNNKRNPSLASDNVRITCQKTDVAARLQQQIQKSKTANADLPRIILDRSKTPRNRAPVLSNTTSTYLQVSENSPVGTVILNFGEHVTDEDSGYNGELTYVISSLDDPHGAFVLDSVTGQLKVFSRLDFERKSEYFLTLTVTDQGEPPLKASKDVRLTLLDENDNVPLFEKPLYTAKISEDELVNSTVLQVKATDLDTGVNAEIVYSIISDDRDFSIDPMEGVIKVKRSLDRETRPSQVLIVQAEDSGTKTKLASTTVVNITITDVNDNAPVFVPEKYIVRAREDLPEGTIITTLTAHDLDEGVNGRVTYSFAHGIDSNFEIDEQTGSVRIKGALDYETKQVYNITCVAKDGGESPLTSTCLIIIEVMDVNENLHAPVFPDFYARGSVAENMPVGSYVMHVQAEDQDGADTGVGQVFYTIQDGSGLGRFSIDVNGTIRTSQVLDRETTAHYWLTIFAQDRALVPKFARLEVLIEVDDVNDNIPQSIEPAYYASVEENSNSIKKVVQIQATDGDYDGTQNPHFSITSGNPQNFFAIDPDTGVISTTDRILDREKQEEHALEITISDRGSPPLSSTTRVVIKVIDENDNRPEFPDRIQRITVFETAHNGQEDIFVYRAVAYDADEGRNGDVSYSLKSSKDSPFRIDRSSGKIYSTISLLQGQMYELLIRAVDNGVIEKKSQLRLHMEVIGRSLLSQHQPRFTQPVSTENIPENERPGSLIILLSADDDDRVKLRYSIEDGNEDDRFTIQPDHGSIFLAGPLDWETKSNYNLTVAVTDGLSSDNATVVINVMDINDNEPVFSHKLYRANISENAELGSPVVRVNAVDKDRNKLLLYTIESAASTGSLNKFSIGAKNGVIVVSGALDREDLSRHLLTVMVRDQGVPSKRSFSRVEISVQDHNDHAPRFLSEVIKGQVYESAALETSVLQVIAVDADKGPNAELAYAIVSGNADNTFSIDRQLGIISVAKELDRRMHWEFEMVVSATDHGEPPLSSNIQVKVTVTISTNSPPKFTHDEYGVELQENVPSGTVVTSVSTESLSTVAYAIVSGNEEGYFTINPNSGVISTMKPVDYEEQHFFNLTISATNIVSASQWVTLVIHIIDINDNAPAFVSPVYVGNISESVLQGSIVLDTSRSPLVVQATDKDSSNNARLFYQILDRDAQQYFAIDPNTGAIRTVAPLDYETKNKFNFSVQVSDMGNPQLQAYQTAIVVIHVADVNDCPPRFTQHTYQATVVLPTYSDVSVLQVHAEDSDTIFDKPMTYSIVTGNDDLTFGIDSIKGVIFVKNDSLSATKYEFSVQVTDGKFSILARVFISVQQTGETSLKFTKDGYTATISENTAAITQLAIIQAVGLDIGRHVSFTLLNNYDLFTVGRTSGVLSTAGIEFDREEKDSYTVVVKVEDASSTELSAHVVVIVSVQDENDNPPMFLNLPYHCTVSGDAKEGEVIQVVKASDPDIGQNGEIKYSLADTQGDRFAINPYTREIVVKRLDERDHNTELTLKVVAQDRGSPPLTAVAAIHVHIIDSSSPLFEQATYEASVPENVEPHTPVIAIKAISPHGQKLIYSISRGDQYGDFALDFNTDMETRGPCYLSVVGLLDYEDKKLYTLTVRASDIFTGSYAEATVNVNVEDVNDNAPLFSSLLYLHTLSESSPIGTRILKVNTTDADSGANSLIHFELAPITPGNRDHETFNAETGEIILRKELDHEKQKEFQFLVIAKDSGMPVLSATSQIIIKILDLNDNPPAFTQPSYSCYISDSATRGQLVFKVVALDPDESDADNLLYSIVGGNDKFTFSINPNSGIISLSEQRQPMLATAYTLNVSVTDGVYTSFARVTVDVRNINRFTPVFGKQVYNVVVSEIQSIGSNIVTASATDEDRGNYGMLTYTIMNDEMAKVFSIDADTGEISNKQILDREVKAKYTIPIAATDNGGKMGFATVVVQVRDENDNVPQFMMGQYKANVVYNASVGTTVIKVRAEDSDEENNNNAKVVYRLHPGNDPMVEKLFDVNAYSGAITTKVDLSESVNQVFQFFVRAADQGEVPLENHVPVEIQVMGANDTPPVFTESNRLFFVDENEQVGAVIATVQAKSVVPISYSIISGFTSSTNYPITFTVDAFGQLRLMRRLDREKTPSYTLFVRAQSNTSPPLVDYMEINIQVRDVNDNTPLFACYPYSVTLPENSQPQHSILQLQASDLDLEVKPLKFSFGPGMVEMASIFSIDPETGWIVLLTQLDREKRDQYNLTVVVSDTPVTSARKTGKGESLTSTTSVVITITDYNDNPPVFDRDMYSTAVNEGALPGTVLITLITSDADTGPNSVVTYYITEGDQLRQFEIHSTGELFVNKALDRETRAKYSLRVAATDGAYVTYATVNIDILDDNDNAPICSQPFHQVEQNEDVIKGTPVAHIHANDADERGTVNARIEYSLQGDGADYFLIDKETGLVRTAKLLDREMKPKYELIAFAQDGGGLKCTTSVLISLKDVNDNPPVFGKDSLREAYNIQEDAQIHTLLTRVIAQDADIGINSQIHYRLSPDTNNVFSMDADSGIISLAATLDRESNPSYNLTVIAYNPINPEFSTEATIKVVVLDVNDNPPEFEHSSYFSSIEESARFGAVVTRVRATSLDIGVNADITYTINAGNEQGKFAIDPHKGLLTVARPLDHELSREYFLTVLATDQGSPPLTNTAIVSINITDINDNPPHFSQHAYTAHVSESVSEGTEIFKVMATDSDSLPNAIITYSIMDGNINNQFIIDPKYGILQINAPLDREITGSYSLVIQAHDSGLPMLFSSAVVSIIVDDANDNPPVFSQDHYKGLVQNANLASEGRRTGIEIVTVSVADADLPENGQPFTFEILKGNDNGEFYIDGNGVISTAGKLAKKVQENYELTVRAYDSGKPPLYADATVEIEVVDDSLYPPEVRDISITIRSCMKNFASGVIGRVEAHDQDAYDKTIFSIVSPNSHLFDIHRYDGRLIAQTGLDAGNYVVNVSVSDGKYTSYGKVDIVVICPSQEMLENALTIQFENMIEEQFYANFKADFQRVLKQDLDVRTSDIEILNVQPAIKSSAGRNKIKQQGAAVGLRRKRNVNDNLDVLFAVRKSPDRFYSKKVLKRKVDKIRGRIESVLGARVIDIFVDMCNKNSCEIGSCVGRIHFDESTLVPVLVNGASFVSARHQYTEQCVCLEGECVEQVCGDTTCTANKVCQKNAYGDYTCQCPEGRTGEMCDSLVPLCSGSSCPIERPMTFAGKSYAKWKLQHSTKKRFSLRFRIRTRQASAVLMYAKGKVDYSILKIERGNLIYKFDCGSGEGQVRIPVDLSDGQWHMVQLDRNGREAELALDSSYTAMGVAPGIHAILNVETEEIYFGAEVDVFPNGYRDISQGFEGCMEDIRVFSIPLPFSGSNEVAQALEFELVEFHCQDYPVKFLPGGDACSSNPCLNGGQCRLSGLNSFMCICSGRYKGPKCELDSDPCHDQPCSNGGQCEVDMEVPNSFHCHCKENPIGVRCSYGKFCRPNPCKHGGICVEGPTAPLCDCAPGYQGLYCDRTSDPCDSSPCQHGAVCHSFGTSYFCNCTPDYSGKNCEQMQLIPSQITESPASMLYGIVGAVAGILFVVLILILCLVWRRRKRELRRRRHTPTGLPESGSEGLLSGLKDKRCKLSNPDLSVPVQSFPSQPPPHCQPPPVPTRPASYTPSTHDSLNVLNNLDSAGNYGSAADDLENTGLRGHILDYYQYMETFNNPSHSSSAHPLFRATPPPASRAASESDSIQKAPWEFEYPNILQNYMDGDKKQHDKLAKQMPGVHSPQTSPGLSRARSQGRALDGSSLSSLPESEDDLNGYHWDTSDWAPGPSMPNISEIPTNEILDSPLSSQPSDDCNANAGTFDDNMTTRAIYNGDDESPLLSSDEQRQNNIDTSNINDDEDDDDDDDNVISRLIMDDHDQDYFEDSEYVGDSEYAENEPYERDELPPSYADHPKYEQLLQGLDDSYELPASLNIHPNLYLPSYNLSHQDLDTDPLTEDENMDQPQEAVYFSPAAAAAAVAATRISSSHDHGYPALRPPKEFMTPGYLTDEYTTDQEPPSRTSFIDDMSLSLGGFTSNASCSDISGLCELEDSEVNNSDTDDENTPCLNTGQLQTQV